LIKSIRFRRIKKPRLESVPSFVSGFANEGYSPGNFNSPRSDTLSQLFQLAEARKSVLVASPSFTGKTTMWNLFKKFLEAKDIPVLSFTLLHYDPDEKSLNQFLKEKMEYQCGGNSLSWDHWNETLETCYLLVDEYQMTFATNDADVRLMWPQLKEDQVKSVVATHKKFHEHLKGASSSPLRIICFSSCGSEKPGSLLSTPFAFGKRVSFCQFSSLEMEEIFKDFVNRTILGWIKKGGLPSSFKAAVSEMTSSHVGFVANILAEVNLKRLTIIDEDSLISFLFSYSSHPSQFS